jgi:hypothetical protein
MAIHRRPALLTVLAALVLAAGCGGDDDGGGGDTLTASEYREKGNAMCLKAKADAGKIPLPKSPGDLADYVERTFDIGFASSAEFGKLNPPEELRKAHDAALRQTDESRDEFDTVVEKVRGSGNPTKTLQSEIRKLAPILEESEEYNRKLGLTDCLQVGAPSQPPEDS